MNVSAWSARHRGGGRREVGSYLDQAGGLGSQQQSKRHPGRLPPGTAGVEPPGRVPDPLHEVPLPRVVHLPGGGFVREIGGIGVVGVEQNSQQVGRGLLGYELPAPKVQHMTEIGEIQAMVQ